MKHVAFPLLAVLLTGASVLAQQKTVTIAVVNNELKKLSPKFEADNPDIKLNWVVVEENILRQRVTTDVSTGSGQFDLVFIGLYETPLFAKRGWLKEMGNIPADYDIEDVFKSIRDGLSYEGKLYALPFYGESSMLMYRKDLFDERDSRCLNSRPTMTSRNSPMPLATKPKASTGSRYAGNRAGAKTWPTSVR
ncbi:MAG TPA: extracellular solute-binding protein, partial [Chthoniobacterales bacterium]|nr:extracellular solute-binding protein [Chthoniobacterales bacterium]